MTETTEIETHPWPPFIPDNAKILIMGTFPPGDHRWSMDFYYPNRSNDFWRIMGIVFFGNADALYDKASKTFILPAIKELLTEKGIALNDTGYRVRRLKGNASDKFLEIVEPVDLCGLLDRMPLCHDIATTGEKAGDTLAAITGTTTPAIGTSICKTFADGRTVNIWRMPSTSRAYPLKPEKRPNTTPPCSAKPDCCRPLNPLIPLNKCQYGAGS